MTTARERSQSQQRQAKSYTSKPDKHGEEDLQAIARRVLTDLEGFLNDTDSIASDDESEDSVAERGPRIPLTLEELTLVVDTSIQRHRQQPISTLDHHDTLEAVASEQGSEAENEEDGSDEEDSDSDDEPTDAPCLTPIADFQRLLAQKAKAFRQQQQENRQDFARATSQHEKRSQSIWSSGFSPRSAIPDHHATGSSLSPEIEQQTQPLRYQVEGPAVVSACDHHCCSSKTKEFSQQTRVMRTKDQATNMDTPLRQSSPAESESHSNQADAKQAFPLPASLAAPTTMDIGIQLSPPLSARSVKAPSPVVSDAELKHIQPQTNYCFEPREPSEPPLRAQSLAASSCPSLHSSSSSLSLSGIRSFASDPTHSRVSSTRSRHHTRHSSRRQSSSNKEPEAASKKVPISEIVLGELHGRH